MDIHFGSTYLWTKALHTLFVIGWLAAVFYLPRILVNLAEAGGHPAVRERLLLMGRKLYGFGHLMLGLALLLGLLLWAGRLIDPTLWPHVTFGQGWMHLKFLLVLLVAGHYIWSGRMLKTIAAGAVPRSARWYRIYNEVPGLLVLVILWLAIIKPF